jgi:hypothetical protein
MSNIKIIFDMLNSNYRVKLGNIIAVSVILIIFLNVSACNREKELSSPDRYVLVCGDSKVLMVEYPEDNDSIPEMVWHWDAHLANDLPAEYQTKKFNSIDDCKPTPDRKQIMISSSSGAVAIVTLKDKKVTFLADVPNAHSIELLPGNKIVAAASTAQNGNRLMLFEMSQPAELLDSDSLYSAHGVVWDEQRKSLYALGYDVLREYKLQYGSKLILNNEWKIPGESGHDLQLTPEEERLFITEHTGAWEFDISTGKFSKIDNFPDAENIKSLNQNKARQFVYTVPEESWWTYHVTFFNPAGKLCFPDMRVYKARLINH